MTCLRQRLLIWTFICLSAACSNPEKEKADLMASGDRFMASRQYAEAIIQYSRTIQIDPLFSQGYEKLGEVYLKQGDRENAWQSYQRAADLREDDIPLQIRAGGVLLVTQRFDDARRIAERVLDKQPNHVDALVLRANALVGLEGLDTAIKLVEDAIRMAPEQSELYSNLASLKATSGELLAAEASYKQAIAAAPTAAASYLPLGNFYWATRRAPEAEAAFVKAVSLEPDNLLAHRALATFYLGSGRAPRAESSLKYLADHAPEVEHKLALADFYLAAGRRREGLALLEALTKNDDAAARAMTRLAALSLADGQRDQARRLLDETLTRYPRTAPALLLQARMALADGQHEQALRLANEAVSADESYLQALYLLAQLYTEDGDYFQAGETYKRILRENPFAAQAQVQLSRIMLVQNAPDESDLLLNRAMRSVTRSDNTRLTVVRALIERGDLAVAELRLQELLSEFPNTPEVHSLMGAVSFLKRDYAAARTWFERALSGDPNMYDPLSGLVALDLTAKRPADAVARVNARLEAYPTSTALLLLLARTHMATGNPKGAEDALRRAVDANPDSLEAFGRLGQLLYQQGRLDEGLAEFERITKIRPRSVQAMTMIAIILAQQGKMDDAVAQYKRVLAVDPRASVAANNLAWIYAERGTNLDEAVILARVAKQRLPEAIEVSNTLGWVYYRTGQPESLKLALPFLKESADGAPSNPLYRYHYGAALARAGQVPEARAQLQAALNLSADFHGAAETRRLLASLQ